MEGVVRYRRRSWPRVLSCEGYVGGGGGVAADVGSSSGPADVSPDGTYGRALLPPSTIMSHIS